MTALSQLTLMGVAGHRVRARLHRRRNIGQQLVFGQNRIPDSGGVIRIGDPVEILETA